MLSRPDRPGLSGRPISGPCSRRHTGRSRGRTDRAIRRSFLCVNCSTPQKLFPAASMKRPVARKPRAAPKHGVHGTLERVRGHVAVISTLRAAQCVALGLQVGCLGGLALGPVGGRVAANGGGARHQSCERKRGYEQQRMRAGTSHERPPEACVATEEPEKAVWSGPHAVTRLLAGIYYFLAVGKGSPRKDEGPGSVPGPHFTQGT